MSGPLYDLLLQSMRVLFLVGVPIVLALSVASIIVGALQAATSIHDAVLGYAARLAVLFALGYALFPLMWRSISELFVQGLTR